MPLLIENFQELDSDQAKSVITSGNFTGLDPQSVRRLIWRHPHVFWAALTQKLYDLLLYSYRAGWSELPWQDRQTMPWLGAALDWGSTSAEMYANAHALPDHHPVKNDYLTAARDMAAWESTHPIFSDVTAHSQPLNQLLGQPILIGTDGWPVSKLNPAGLDLSESDLTANTYLLQHRLRPPLSPSLQKLISDTAQKALQQNHISLITSL